MTTRILEKDILSRKLYNFFLQIFTCNSLLGMRIIDVTLFLIPKQMHPTAPIFSIAVPRLKLALKCILFLGVHCITSFKELVMNLKQIKQVCNKILYFYFALTCL